ncbi:MAG: 3-hydroxyacyl-[acyl-carrier-protein] dehydratase FabZ [Candidatus Anoxychlamydiales bacterium]|nr:3-hydroxyacyl-[acyl-carrier-protein] dehydratase FabZ [Candidatus Anoxychlamydiales bacterium]
MDNKTVIDHRKIAKILPHRYPFLLVDRVVHIDLENSEIIGLKNVTINEHFFSGHFPNVPIMPGVLVIEAMAQTGGILVHQKGYVGKIAVLLNVTSAKFRRPIYPGDVIYLHVKAIHISSKGGRMSAKALVDEKIAVEAELSFALVEKDKL